MTNPPGADKPAPRALRLGVAGRVGTGKTSLIALLCRELADDLAIAVVTHDTDTDEDLAGDSAPPDLVLVEIGGDSLTESSSPDLVDAHIFVLDVAGAGDVARTGGPGTSRADLLVIDTTDLAPHVEVDVEQLVDGAAAARDGQPVLALSREDPASIDRLCAWVRRLHHEHGQGHDTPTDPGSMAPPSRAPDDGDIPDKQIWRWKDDGGAIGSPV